MQLLEPLDLGPRTVRNRIIFGPHETNLGRGRAISDRHVAYYRRRAAGGAAVIVTEEASVHTSDWPYERCPLASACERGWAAVGAACHAEGALVVAALGHAGGQGSSAYSQAALWAPSRVPEVNSREVPKWMEPADIAAVVEGFETSARLAIGAGMDGVEINAGQHSLVRQFLSGLTNQRDDEWGRDRLTFARAVLTAAREGAGDGAVIGLRLSCDELAPWAGIVPDAAAEIATELAPMIDYLTVVRGSIFTVSATRPDCHTEQGFNRQLLTIVRAAVGRTLTLVGQGSIVEVAQAEQFLGDTLCDAVEMTRAQIADPSLANKAAAGDNDQIRPCLLCNQTCQVRDARNPIVTCVLEPSSGHEDADPAPDTPTADALEVMVVGGGVAGLECARVAALSGHRVAVVDRGREHDDGHELGGMTRVAAMGAGRDRLHRAWQWLVAECTRLGVSFETGREVTPEEVMTFAGEVVLCTGSLPGRQTYTAAELAVVHTAAEVLDGARLHGHRVVVWDPIGGPIGISVAELLRRGGLEVAVVTSDLIAGNELSRTGDLAPANVRLLASGVTIERRSILRQVLVGEVELEDRFTGDLRRIPADVVIDAGHRLPDDWLWRATGERFPRAGDAVAPRTIHEAILEGRRCALELSSTRHRVRA